MYRNKVKQYSYINKYYCWTTDVYTIVSWYNVSNLKKFKCYCPEYSLCKLRLCLTDHRLVFKRHIFDFQGIACYDSVGTHLHHVCNKCGGSALVENLQYVIESENITLSALADVSSIEFAAILVNQPDLAAGL